MHVFVVGNSAIAFFLAFVIVAAAIKLKKKTRTEERKATGSVEYHLRQLVEMGEVTEHS
jgi:hypothetical protein